MCWPIRHKAVIKRSVVIQFFGEVWVELSQKNKDNCETPHLLFVNTTMNPLLSIFYIEEEQKSTHFCYCNLFFAKLLQWLNEQIKRILNLEWKVYDRLDNA